MKQIHKVLRVGFEPGTHGLEVQHPNHSATLPPFQSKTTSLSYTLRMSQNDRISCNRHVFTEFSVVLIQLRSPFCQNVAPFDILRFSHHFFYVAADFVTLSYTKMAIFHTLLYTVSLKKAPLSGGASPFIYL